MEPDTRQAGHRAFTRIVEEIPVQPDTRPTRLGMNLKPVAGFVAAGILVLLVALATLWTVKQNARSVDMQRHTLQVLDSAEDLLTELKEAESGSFGYLTTGDTAFLEPYQAARSNLASQLSYLHKLTRDNPEQQHRLDAVTPLIEEQMALMDQAVDPQNSHDQADALAVLRKGRGKLLMGEIRIQFRAFNKAETELLVRHEASFRNSQSQLSTLILLANTLFVLLLLIAGYLIYRESKQRISAKSEANRLLNKAHQTLREHAARLAEFKYILDHTQDGLFIFQANTLRFSYVNHGAVFQVGYSEDELLNMTPLDIKPEFNESHFRAMLQPLLDGSLDAYTFETLHRHKDGYDVPVEILLQHVQCDSQQSCFIAFARDISARKQAEAELRIAAVAFETQQCLMITDANGVILRVNQAFTQDTGYIAEEAIGQTPRLLKSGRHDAAFYAAMWETLLRTGNWQGEIWDRRKNGEIYPKWLTINAVKNPDGNVSHYVGVHFDLSDRKHAEEEIRSLAFYDPLTRLPNRRLLMDRLHQALASSSRSGRHGALMFLDLDYFKNLNDTMGHDFGDLLLQQVASRLESCVREGDTVARLGGDEFVVMLENLSEQALEASSLTQSVGEKILNVLRQPYQLNSHVYHSTPSIGAVLFNNDRQTIAELLKMADIAMYHAKKAGRNTLRFFDPKMQQAITTRAIFENELRAALSTGQFQLYYQIQMDNARNPSGAEALIRWAHPKRGMIPPDQFIPLAEESGLILPIGLWVLDTVCAQLKVWEQDALTRNLVLAMNVSPRQFHHPEFASQVLAAVQRHEINPAKLELELTERLLLEDVEQNIATMNALKAIGIKLSLDDFGSGYSSLQHLKRMPLDQIKIDPSFVHDFSNGNNPVVHTIILIAQSLDLDVIAEGVEMNEQRQRLMDKGCTHYQGYLFGRPMPIDEFDSLLKQGVNP